MEWNWKQHTGNKFKKMSILYTGIPILQVFEALFIKQKDAAASYFLWLYIRFYISRYQMYLPIPCLQQPETVKHDQSFFVYAPKHRTLA